MPYVLALLALLTLVYETPFYFRVVWAACILLGFYYYYFGRSLAWLTLPSPAKLPRISARAYAYPVAGLAIVVAMLTALEIRQPYYFAQDDSYMQYLPVMVDAMQHFFTEWRLPLWNAYLSVGMSLTSGGYSLFYPPLYLSYLLAHMGGDDYMMLDIFAYLHWIGGYLFMVAALMRLGVRMPLATALSIAFVMAGYHLVTGRSWHAVIVCVLWLPALLLCLVHFLQTPKPSRKWMFITGFVIGMFALGDHMQYWAYGVIIFGLGILCFCFMHIDHWRLRMSRAISALLFGLALACPVVVLQTLEMPPLGSSPYGDSMRMMLNGMLIPWPFKQLSAVSESLQLAPVYFFGGISLLVSMVMLCLMMVKLARGESNKKLTTLWVFLGLAVFCLLWSFGFDGGIWWALSTVWPFTKFNSPHKLYPVLTLTLSVTAGLFLEAWLRHYKNKWLMPALCLSIVALSLFNAWNCTMSRFNFADKPYPTLPSYLYSLRSPLKDKGVLRTLAVAASHNPDVPTTLRLMNNHANVYRIFSVNRYGQRVTTTPADTNLMLMSEHEPYELLHRYGVGYLWIADYQPSDYWFTHNLVFNAGGYLHNNPDVTATRKAYNGASLYYVHDANTDPLLFYFNHPERGLNFTVLGDGLYIGNVSPGVLVANFFYHPWMKAYAGETELQLYADKYSRMILVVPNNAKGAVMLQFSPPWQSVLLIAIGFLLLSAVPALPWKRF